MSIFIINDWVVNNDKTITFYDIKQHNNFKTGKTKDFTYDDKRKVKSEPFVLNKFEHLFNPKGCNISYSVQFTGLHIYIKGVKSGPSIIILAYGRRMKENKNFLQSENEIEVLFGLKEAEIEEEEIAEEIAEKEIAFTTTVTVL